MKPKKEVPTLFFKDARGFVLGIPANATIADLTRRGIRVELVPRKKAKPTPTKKREGGAA